MAKIIIVDDALFIRKQLRKIFEDILKFEVVAEGADGLEAIDAYAKYSPDLMTLDLTMPNKGGLEVIQEIMKEDKNAKILVISAIQDRALMTEAIHSGAKGFIPKPIQAKSKEFLDNFIMEVNEILSEK